MVLSIFLVEVTGRVGKLRGDKIHAISLLSVGREEARGWVKMCTGDLWGISNLRVIDADPSCVVRL